jgi:hypothetical protein
MFWQLTSFPRCAHHVFLSHCAEDRDHLVRPVYDALVAGGVVPWLDQEDYYYGRDSRTALRDGLLRSRHAVFFVTPAMLSTARGWCVLELGLTELLELSLQVRGGKLANLFLPLFFVSQADDQLPRSVWQAVRDRGRFHHPDRDGDPTDWSRREIREYLLREQSLSRDVAEMSRQDPRFAEGLHATPGLYDRVAKFHPRRLPTLSGE